MNAHQRGYTRQWRNVREVWLRNHPFCGDTESGEPASASFCKSDGRLTPAYVIDHTVPHGGDSILFWDQANWAALCEPCHNRKTATEDGGFIQRIPGQRFVVTGPPGSGKTTWVEKRARPGDIVFDLDAIAQVVTRIPRYPRPLDATHALLAMRDGLLSWLESATVLVHTFVIVTDEKDASHVAMRIKGQVVHPRHGC